jgi:hypothetical protein
MPAPPPAPPPPPPEPDTPSVAGEEDPGAALDDPEPDAPADDDGAQDASGASRRPRSEPQRRA